MYKRQPFVAAADKAGIDPIFIAPAQASEQTLQGVAQYSRGYIYAISRDGVTGTEKESETRGLVDVVNNVQRFGGAPILLGFGISTPQHVADAVAAGAAGAITGSALTKIVDAHLDEDNKPTDGLATAVTDFVAKMKAATKRAGD